MKKSFLIIVLFFSLQTNFAQQLSENSEVSLLTIQAGTELYSAFGHSAIRVKDADSKIDLVFNYGTFDFDDPNFYSKFVHGDLNYMVSVGAFEYFMQYYQVENRSVYEQVLNITLSQKQKIFDFLQWNALPENKFYRYDFFFNNCATKLRDIFEETLDNKIVYHDENKNLTFRNLLHQYLNVEGKEWGKLGIDLILGAKTDKLASTREYMFLPDYVMFAYEKAGLQTSEGEKPLVKPTEILFQAKTKQATQDLIIPSILFWTIFVLYSFITLAGIKFKKRFYLADFVLFIAAGISGLILFYAWFLTNHTITVNNYNLLWLIFTHFFFAFFLFGKKNSKFFNYYLLISGSINVLLLATWLILPQSLNSWALPLILTLIMRQVFLFLFEKKIAN